MTEGFTLLHTCTLNGLANIFVHNKINDFAGHWNESPTRQQQQRQQRRHHQGSPQLSAGIWCLCCNTTPTLSANKSRASSNSNEVRSASTTFFRQAFFDLVRVKKKSNFSQIQNSPKVPLVQIFAVEIIGMVSVGSRSRLQSSDADYRRAFRPLACSAFALFALGLILKAVYYATCHLWSDLILARATRACCCCTDRKRRRARRHSEDEDIEMKRL